MLAEACHGKSCSPYAICGFASRPRWGDTHLHSSLTMDAFHFDIQLPQDAPVSTQERAYTPPIWYTPAG